MDIILLSCIFCSIAATSAATDVRFERENVTEGRAFSLNPFTSFNNLNTNGFNGLNGFNNFNTLFGINRRQQVLYSDCTTQVGTTGICMRPLECVKNSGVPSGLCTVGTVCCSVSLRCNGASSAKRIVIDNSVQTTASTTSCTYMINRFSQYVCQLRVDFNTNFPQTTQSADLVPGARMPVCSTSYLQIHGMRFCGVNNNQHVYIPFTSATSISPISAVVGPNENGFWRMTITQLECPPSSNLGNGITTNPGVTTTNGLTGTNIINNNLFTTQSSGQILDLQNLLRKRNFDTDLIAPNGCLQYYPASSGTFESFNYNGGTGPYPPDMQYAICFNRPPTATALQLFGDVFSMSANMGQPSVDENCYDPITMGNSNDFLFIPYSTLMDSDQVIDPPANRYCGNVLNMENVVANPPGPFTVLVNTGNFFQRPPNGNLGFARAFRFNYNII